MEITKYLDIPFQDHGRDRNGIDCWGLVRLFYREQLGIELPNYLETDYCTKDTQNIAGLIQAGKQDQWLSIPEPERFCVVQIRVMGYNCHCGIYLGDNKCLHVMPKTSSCVIDLSRPNWVKRIAGYAKPKL